MFCELWTTLKNGTDFPGGSDFYFVFTKVEMSCFSRIKVPTIVTSKKKLSVKLTGRFLFN